MCTFLECNLRLTHYLCRKSDGVIDFVLSVDEFLFMHARINCSKSKRDGRETEVFLRFFRTCKLLKDQTAPRFKSKPPFAENTALNCVVPFKPQPENAELELVSSLSLSLPHPPSLPPPTPLPRPALVSEAEVGDWEMEQVPLQATTATSQCSHCFEFGCHPPPPPTPVKGGQVSLLFYLSVKLKENAKRASPGDKPL